MATSRPIRVGEWLTDIRTGSPFIGSNIRATVHEVRRPQGYILQSDFGLDGQGGDAYWQLMRERVFGMTGDGDIHIAITNGTAPGLYVRDGDDTSDWETYRQVLARRVEEAMAARRGCEGGVGVGETVTTTATARRRDDEIRVGDVVEVVSCSDAFTATADVGGGGRVVSIEHENAPTRAVYLSPCDGLRVPRAGFVSLADVRKVSSPSSPQTVAATVSPMPDEEASRIEAAVSDEVRRRISSPLASGDETTTTTATARRRDDEIRVGDVVEVVSCRSTGWTTVADVGTRGRVTEIDESVGTVHLESYRGQRLPQEGIAGLADVRKVSSPSPQNTTASVSPMSDQEAARIATTVADEVRRGGDETTAVRRVVNPVPPTAGVYIGPATIRFDDRAFTGIITATGPLRRGEPPVSSPPTTASSRFSLLEVDLPPEPTSPISRSLDADLAALQEELRVERERNRAQAAAQMQKTRFDLLECDLPAVPVAAAPAATVDVKAPSRPVVSSPLPRRPVETITDLTTARSPLELARMLEGLNDELTTMMRQREAN